MIRLGNNKEFHPSLNWLYAAMRYKYELEELTFCRDNRRGEDQLHIYYLDRDNLLPEVIIHHT